MIAKISDLTGSQRVKDVPRIGKLYSSVNNMAPSTCHSVSIQYSWQHNYSYGYGGENITQKGIMKWESQYFISPTRLAFSHKKVHYSSTIALDWLMSNKKNDVQNPNVFTVKLAACGGEQWNNLWCIIIIPLKTCYHFNHNMHIIMPSHKLTHARLHIHTQFQVFLHTFCKLLACIYLLYFSINYK